MITTNGNAEIELRPDGTRVTTFEGELKLDYPRQADVKLTNWCNMEKICVYCHESSNKKGKHADYDYLVDVLSQCGPGTEWAFGGGSTLDYPYIEKLLDEVKDNRQIANVTVNQLHLKKQLTALKYYIKHDLVKGVGISFRDYTTNIKELEELSKYEHCVVHLIAGVNNVNDIQFLHDMFGFNKFLVLGYKVFGEGIKHYEENKNNIESNKKLWYQQIHKYFKDYIISFDNLALEQLNIKRWLSEDEWNSFYQGDDHGQSGSMYIDGVKQQFAKTSRSVERTSSNDLIKFFKQIHT